METVTFSRRLYGVPGTLIFLAITLGFGLNVIQHMQARGSPAGTALMLTGITLYSVVGIIGWRYCLRHRSVRWAQGYFVFQTLLFFGLFWLENADTHSGAVVGNLSIPLLVQCGVLGWRSRGQLHLTIILIMVLVTTFYLPDGQIDGRTIQMAAIVFLTNGSMLLLGHLLVSEEQARETLNDTNRKLTEYADEIEELATVKERNRLAREIHDNLGHYLTAVNMQIEAALAVMDIDQRRATASLVKAQALTKEGLAEIRRSIAALRAAPTEARPLHEAITLLVEENRAAGLEIRYQVDGPIRPCSAQVEMALYRIAQEGMTNIRKHAHATQAELELSYRDPQRVGFKMQDNGQGSAQSSGGFGLLGIQERVNLLGGSLTIDTVQGNGFCLLVEIPA